jgi:nucleotide-binding universal stress UspA family protein
MIARCPTCGAHVPESIAIEIPTDGGRERYCSLRCAIADDRQPSVELPPAPQRILVAVDGSGPSLRATELAATLARASGARVELIHAIDPNLLRTLPIDAGPEGVTRLGIVAEQLEARLRHDAEAQLERCQRICEAAGIAVDTRVALEAPNQAIARAAEEFDLIVIGSRGLGATSAERLGSLSHRVIADTTRPVLVVH